MVVVGSYWSERTKATTPNKNICIGSVLRSCTCGHVCSYVRVSVEAAVDPGSLFSYFFPLFQISCRSRREEKREIAATRNNKPGKNIYTQVHTYLLSLLIPNCHCLLKRPSEEEEEEATLL